MPSIKAATAWQSKFTVRTAMVILSALKAVDRAPSQFNVRRELLNGGLEKAPNFGKAALAETCAYFGMSVASYKAYRQGGRTAQRDVDRFKKNITEKIKTMRPHWARDLKTITWNFLVRVTTDLGWPTGAQLREATVLELFQGRTLDRTKGFGVVMKRDLRGHFKLNMYDYQRFFKQSVDAPKLYEIKSLAEKKPALHEPIHNDIVTSITHILEKHTELIVKEGGTVEDIATIFGESVATALFGIFRGNGTTSKSLLMLIAEVNGSRHCVLGGFNTMAEVLESAVRNKKL